MDADETGEEEEATLAFVRNCVETARPYQCGVHNITVRQNVPRVQRYTTAVLYRTRHAVRETQFKSTRRPIRIPFPSCIQRFVKRLQATCMQNVRKPEGSALGLSLLTA